MAGVDSQIKRFRGGMAFFECRDRSRSERVAGARYTQRLIRLGQSRHRPAARGICPGAAVRSVGDQGSVNACCTKQLGRFESNEEFIKLISGAGAVR